MTGMKAVTDVIDNPLPIPTEALRRCHALEARLDGEEGDALNELLGYISELARDCRILREQVKEKRGEVARLSHQLTTSTRTVIDLQAQVRRLEAAIDRDAVAQNSP